MAKTSLSTGTFRVDVDDLKLLAKDLKAAGPDVARGARLRMKEAARVVADEAKERSRFSSRIPGSIRVSVTGVLVAKVVAGNAKAPDAAPIENNGKGFVRHPVFGDRMVWTAKNSHAAFLAPALDAKIDEVTEAIAAVIDDAMHEVGFEGS